MIAKDTEAEIIRLFHGEKWPIGTIATELGVHYTTVQRVLRQLGGVEAKVVAPTGCGGTEVCPRRWAFLELVSGRIVRAARCGLQLEIGKRGATTELGRLRWWSGKRLSPVAPLHGFLSPGSASPTSSGSTRCRPRGSKWTV